MNDLSDVSDEEIIKHYSITTNKMTKEEQMYISAVRYALGRMSYIVGDTVDFMMSKNLSEKCKELMVRDIDEAMEAGNFGMGMDVKEWLKLKDYLTN